MEEYNPYKLRYFNPDFYEENDKKLTREVLFCHYGKKYNFIGIFTETNYILKVIKFFSIMYPNWHLDSKDITQLSPAELRGMPQCQKFLNKMKKAKEKWR